MNFFNIENYFSYQVFVVGLYLSADESSVASSRPPTKTIENEVRLKCGKIVLRADNKNCWDRAAISKKVFVRLGPARTGWTQCYKKVLRP